MPVATSTNGPRDVKLLNRFFQYVLPASIRNYMFYSPIKPITEAFVKVGMERADSDGLHGTHQRISNLKRANDWVRMLAAPNSVVSLLSAELSSIGPGSRVNLADGRSIDVDEIVACTGYRLDFDYLPEQLLESTMLEYTVPAVAGAADQQPTVRTQSLFNRIMHPEYPTLNFFSQLSTLGNEAAVGEMQARWVVSMLSGGAASNVYTLSQIRALCKQARAKLQKTRPLFPGWVAYLKYMDALASDIGCSPPNPLKFKTWWRDSSLAWWLLFGPAVPAQYRLNGPDSSPAEARKALSFCWSRL